MNMNGTGNGNSNACFCLAEQAYQVNEKRPFTPIVETTRKLDDMADECINMSDALARSLFGIDPTESVPPSGICFSDTLETMSYKLARVSANLKAMIDRFGLVL